MLGRLHLGPVRHIRRTSRTIDHLGAYAAAVYGMAYSDLPSVFFGRRRGGGEIHLLAYRCHSCGSEVGYVWACLLM